MKYLHIMPPWYVFHGEGNLRQPNVPLGPSYLTRAAADMDWDTVIWNGDLLPQGKENQYSEEMTAYDGYLVNQSRDDNPVWQELRQVIKTQKPDAVGITALTASYPSALRCAAIVKQESPQTLVVLGGPHVNALPDEVAQQPNVDIAVFGEGERTLQDILNRHQHDFNLFNIPGAVVKQGVGSPRQFVPELDALGWPEKGNVIDDHKLLKQDHYGLVMFARGCPYYCEFCASPELWTRKVRWRSAKDMAAEMMAIHMQYDTRYFSFEDDTFTLNRKRTIELMKAIIDSGLPTVPGFRWTCNTRPDAVDPELLETMKRAGCAAVAVGIESGNPRMLKKIQKAFTISEVKQAIRDIKSVGLISSGQFMFGLPTETKAEMLDTVALADELECESVMLSVATPLPATQLYEEALALGLIPQTGIDWATVTTKNNGMLMTIEKDGKYLPMPLEQRLELVAEIQAAFDKVQNKTIKAKNASRHYYEAQYLPAEDVAPVYGFKI